MALVMTLPLDKEGPMNGSGLWCSLMEGEATLWCPLEVEPLFDMILSIYQWRLQHIGEATIMQGIKGNESIKDWHKK